MSNAAIQFLKAERGRFDKILEEHTVEQNQLVDNAIKARDNANRTKASIREIDNAIHKLSDVPAECEQSVGTSHWTCGAAAQANAASQLGATLGGATSKPWTLLVPAVGGAYVREDTLVETLRMAGYEVTKR